MKPRWMKVILTNIDPNNDVNTLATNCFDSKNHGLLVVTAVYQILTTVNHDLPRLATVS